MRIISRLSTRLRPHLTMSLLALAGAVATAQTPGRDQLSGDGRMPVFVDVAALSEAHGDRIGAIARGRVAAVIAAAEGTAIDFNALLVVAPSLTLLSEERLERTLPPMTSVRVQLTLSATLANKRAPNGTVVRTLGGVGRDRESAFVNALEGLDPNDGQLIAYFARLQGSIVSAFARDCDGVLSQARTRVLQGDEVGGFVVLDGIPMGAQSCHARAEGVMGDLVRILQERRCTEVLTVTRAELRAGRVMAAVTTLTSAKRLTPACLTAAQPVAREIDAEGKRLAGDEKSSVVDSMAKWRNDSGERLADEARTPTATQSGRVALARARARMSVGVDAEPLW